MAEQYDLSLCKREQQPGLSIHLHPHQPEKQRDHRPAAQAAQGLKAALGQPHMKLAIAGVGRGVFLNDRYLFHAGRSPELLTGQDYACTRNRFRYKKIKMNRYRWVQTA